MYKTCTWFFRRRQYTDMNDPCDCGTAYSMLVQRTLCDARKPSMIHAAKTMHLSYRTFGDPMIHARVRTLRSQVETRAFDVAHSPDSIAVRVSVYQRILREMTALDFRLVTTCMYVCSLSHTRTVVLKERQDTGGRPR